MRGIHAEPEEITALAERSGLDGKVLLARTKSAKGPDLGDLGRLAEELGLGEGEMRQLALAYTFEERLDAEADALRRANDALGEAAGRIKAATPAAFADEDEYFRAASLVAETGQLVARAQRRRAEA